MTKNDDISENALGGIVRGWPRELPFTMEPVALLAQIHRWVAGQIPVEGVRLSERDSALDACSPDSPHPFPEEAAIHFPLEQGRLAFYRETPFSHAERRGLAACVTALQQPLHNTLRYHAACHKNRRLNSRLGIEAPLCASLKRLEPVQRTVALSKFVSGHELMRAVQADELLLYYQPKVSLQGGRVMGLEALLRWHHPERGLLQPDEFIPLAERSGAIRGITRWVLNAVVRQCAVWHRQQLLVPIAVNLSGLDLQDLALPGYLAQLLKSWAVPAEYLELELTETMAIRDERRSIEVLRRIAELGINVAVDDFGTGYSSLQRLKQLPINIIKIDKSFVTNIAANAQDRVMVDAITDLGHRLGMKVVAEGVESDEGWRHLAAAGCDMGQGFHISRPLSGEAITGWLRDSLLPREPLPGFGVGGG